MIAYASRTGTRRNLAALRGAGWRLLLSPEGVLRTEGFPFGLDNGAWSAYQKGHGIDLGKFERAVERFGGAADWVVAPDIVAGGLASLDLTTAWLPRLRHLRRVLVAVQDGMTPRDVAPLVSHRVGIFLGGTTTWKLGTMQRWGDWCASLGLYYHVARVNSAERIRAAARAGAASFDGTSASRYAVTVSPLDKARRQPNMFPPEARP
jgi:hypothetical protein